MDYKNLGLTDLSVSKICLGTMTYGEQNTESEAFAQMDYAYNEGVNFFDTAELYPVPHSPKNWGESELIIGKWLKERGLRDKIVLSSKIVGNASHTQHIRKPTDFSKKSIEHALFASLKRLQTDYIDVYHLHWPERDTNFFGKLNYQVKNQDELKEKFEESLVCLTDLAVKGFIRHIAVSNETPWGLMKYLELSKYKGLIRVSAIQNPYSLLNRSFEIGLSEISHREKVSFLAYSPLAFGVLTGKYQNNKKPSGARLTIFPNFKRYSGALPYDAIKHYQKLATDNGLSLAQMSLAFVNQQPFLTSNIIGATNISQLQENISSIKIKLSENILSEIENISKKFCNICP